DREGLDALVVRAGTGELPPAGRAEGLPVGLGGPGLAGCGQVDGADGRGVAGRRRCPGRCRPRLGGPGRSRGWRGRWARGRRPCCRFGRWSGRSGRRRWRSLQVVCVLAAGRRWGPEGGDGWLGLAAPVVMGAAGWCPVRHEVAGQAGLAAARRRAARARARSTTATAEARTAAAMRAICQPGMPVASAWTWAGSGGCL